MMNLINSYVYSISDSTDKPVSELVSGLSLMNDIGAILVGFGDIKGLIGV